jgi:hypothetical protein
VDALSSPSGEFLVVADDGYVDLWTAVPEQLTVTAYALVQRRYESWRIYGPDGQVRCIQALAPARPLGPVRTLLAYTVYNPRLETTVTYAQPRGYALEELKEALGRAVEQDDDVLTQFHESDELRQQITAARTHAELVGVIRRTRSPRGTA